MKHYDSSWSGRVIRFAIFRLVRLFYPRIEVQGRENLPADRPIIFVLNHPNGLIDPLLLMTALDRPVSFLAKSTLFGNPVGRWLCQIFGALPIFRKRDEGLAGGPHGDAPKRNELTFAQCRKLLSRGGAMALFPEGTTHSGSQLLPLRTGAARIALSAEDEFEWELGVKIVPVGLWYQSKIHFRTSVLLVVGQPFDVKSYAADYVVDERRAVQGMTAQIDAALDQVVLQAENAELLAAIPILAAWIAPRGEALSVSQQHSWTASLLTAYEHLNQTNPAQVDAIAQEARRYATVLQTLGISNPWALESGGVKFWPLTGLVSRLVLTFPLALTGFAMSYIPYRLAGPLATYAVGPFDTQISTVKLIGGSILVLLAWILEAVVVTSWVGTWWGVLLFASAPACAYIALLWGEDWREVRELSSCHWLQWQHGKLAQSVVNQRHSLARQVMELI